jgi:hypothetical protein
MVLMMASSAIDDTQTLSDRDGTMSLEMLPYLF